MSPDEFMYNYLATAPEICGMKAFNADGTLYAVASPYYSFGELLQLAVDLLYAGSIDTYVIWCEFGLMM